MLYERVTDHSSLEASAIFRRARSCLTTLRIPLDSSQNYTVSQVYHQDEGSPADLARPIALLICGARRRVLAYGLRYHLDWTNRSHR